MRHAAHQAANNSRQYIRTSRSLFSSGSGAHSAKAVRMAQMTQSNGAVLGLDQAVVERLNEVAPQTRRALPEAARVRRASFPHPYLGLARRACRHGGHRRGIGRA